MRGCCKRGFVGVSLKLWVYSSTSQSPNGSDLYPVWELDDFKANESFTKDVTVRIPLGMHNNGTMFIHVFLSPVEEGGRGEDSPFEADWVVNQTGKHIYVSQQTTPVEVTSDDPAEKQDLVAVDHRHWRSCLPLTVMTADLKFDPGLIPSGLKKYIQPYEDQYLPVLMLDEMHYRSKDLLPLNKSCKEMPLTISYTPVSYGTFIVHLNVRLNHQINETNEKEVPDDLKEAINNRLSIIITGECLLAIFVLIWLLSVEREICFWQDKTTMAGLSAQAVVCPCVCTLVIFLHVIDQNRNLLSLTIFSIATVVEIWKVMRAFQVRVSLTEWRLVFNNAAVSDKERETQELDSQAMRCLSYALYPLWVAVFIYNLTYNLQMSWYSLCIQSLYSGFRWFGWLFILPQVFINYKLKSVADLPWEVLMIRAFGDCITYTRLYIIEVPLSSLGLYTLDEIFFVIYLYQRWLYKN